MKKIILPLLLFCTLNVVAQDNESTNVVEMTYLLPKIGHSTELEKALTEHNQKYHPGNPNMAFVRYVDYGKMAGWYVWIMSGNYASLDNRPDDDNHTKSWAETVEPHVEKYGPTQLWAGTKLSTGEAMNTSKRFRAWNVSLKPGQEYRFNDIMDKMKKTQESLGRTMWIMSNAVGSTGEPDYQIIWPFNSFTEWDENSRVIEEFEKHHGEGSWVPFLDEWRDIVDGVDTEVRSVLKV